MQQTLTETEKSAENVFTGWWREMADENASSRNMSGDRAALRKADNITDVLLVPHFHVLRQRMHVESFDGKCRALAVAAAVLAHVRENASGSSFAAQLALKQGDRQVFSELRLKRLVRTEGEADIIRQFRRAIALLHNTANVADLGNTLLWWGVDTPFENARRRLAFAYYDAVLGKK